jgi:hypothetical protein
MYDRFRATVALLDAELGFPVSSAVLIRLSQEHALGEAARFAGLLLRFGL